MSTNREITCPHCAAVLSLTAPDGQNIKVVVKEKGKPIDGDVMELLFPDHDNDKDGG